MTKQERVDMGHRLRQQVTELAKFLTGCGTELLDRYTVLAGEVRIKCRR